jgi:phosphoribosyl-ATP pyrophosphohydrolase
LVVGLEAEDIVIEAGEDRSEGLEQEVLQLWRHVFTAC